MKVKLEDYKDESSLLGHFRGRVENSYSAKNADCFDLNRKKLVNYKNEDDLQGYIKAILNIE